MVNLENEIEGSYKVLRSVELKDGCILEMSAEMSEYTGYERQECITICLLSPTVDENCDPAYDVNNSEVYKISDLERATAAFEYRLANDPWKYSPNCTFFNSIFLDKE